MVARGGFEPPKAFASRFTVCPLWPLGYLAIRTVDSSGTRSDRQTAGAGCERYPGAPGLLTVELAKGIEPPACCLQSSRSTLSYASKRQNFILCTTSPGVNPILARTPRDCGRPPS